MNDSSLSFTDGIQADELLEALLVCPMEENVQLTMVFDDGPTAPLPLQHPLLPYTVQADRDEAILHVPASVISVRVRDTADLLDVLQGPTLVSWQDVTLRGTTIASSARADLKAPIQLVHSARRKRALVIGVPRGDVDPILSSRSEQFQSHLLQCGFLSSEIRFLRNTKAPTRSNIRKELTKMVDWSNKDDSAGSLVVYYCGGSQDRQSNDDNSSSFDAPLIIPSDDDGHAFSGNDILHDFITKLPASVRLTIILDTDRNVNVPLPQYLSSSSKKKSRKKKKKQQQEHKTGMTSLLLGAISSLAKEQVSGGRRRAVHD